VGPSNRKLDFKKKTKKDAITIVAQVPFAMVHLVLASIVAALLTSTGATNTTVLVFGDSWGSFGPSYHEIQATFDRHNVSATVKSAAKGGTRACQWASDPTSLLQAAQDLFPTDGPEFVWYTLGGNDLVDSDFLKCSAGAKTDAQNMACFANNTAKVTKCTELLFDQFIAKFPEAKIMQCGYDFPCLEGSCGGPHGGGFSRNPYCNGDIACANKFTVRWQGLLLDPLTAKYPQYTGLNILGAVQKAGGVAGAEVGKPVMDQGSPCNLMKSCVHPTYGQVGATGVGEAFWDLFFSKHLSPLT
jgi:hypothetical protein